MKLSSQTLFDLFFDRVAPALLLALGLTSAAAVATIGG